jgi:hypothetical protein
MGLERSPLSLARITEELNKNYLFSKYTSVLMGDE